MAKLRGPLFSLDAKGSVANKLTVRKRRKLHVALEYNKPGDRKPFESSPTQKDQRAIVGLVTIRWNCMTDAEKAPWNTAANASREHISGYNLFLRTAQTDLYQYLGLAGYWSMNYEHQGIIPDLSGNGNNGTLKPDYPSNCPTLDPSINHKFGLAGKFDGVDDYIEVPDSPSLDITDAITLEVWTHPNGNQDDYNRIFAKGLSNARTYSIYFVSGTTKVAGIFYDDSGNSRQLAAINSIIEWGHAVITYDLNNINLYLNGKLDNTTAWDHQIRTNTKALRIGTEDINGPYYFNGIIDEARIWNRALGPEEIMRHYKMLRQPNT